MEFLAGIAGNVVNTGLSMAANAANNEQSKQNNLELLAQQQKYNLVNMATAGELNYKYANANANNMIARNAAVLQASGMSGVDAASFLAGRPHTTYSASSGVTYVTSPWALSNTHSQNTTVNPSGITGGFGRDNSRPPSSDWPSFHSGSSRGGWGSTISSRGSVSTASSSLADRLRVHRD